MHTHAYSFGTTHRYGLVILILHDVGDIWLNWAKVFQYVGNNEGIFDALSTSFFVVFVIVFFATRLVFLPITVIPSGYWESLQLKPVFGGRTLPGWGAMNASLVVLQCLHVFWFGLIMKAAKRKIFKGELADQREGEGGTCKSD